MKKYFSLIFKPLLLASVIGVLIGQYKVGFWLWVIPAYFIFLIYEWKQIEKKAQRGYVEPSPVPVDPNEEMNKKKKLVGVLKFDLLLILIQVFQSREYFGCPSASYWLYVFVLIALYLLIIAVFQLPKELRASIALTTLYTIGLVLMCLFFMMAYYWQPA